MHSTYLPHISGAEDLMQIIGDSGREEEMFGFMMSRGRGSSIRPFFSASQAASARRANPSSNEPPPKISRQSSTRDANTPNADVQYQDAEWWPLNKEDERYEFVNIAALHEELLALDSCGRLHQWNWHDSEPYRVVEDGDVIFHPKTKELGLLNEEVTQLAGSVCRASIITKSNKIAILADAIINPFENLIDTPAAVHSELGDLSNALLYTCSQWTLVIVRNEAFWMGVAPYELRKRQLEAISKQASKKQEALSVGSVVCLKKQPAYRARTRAIKLLDNQPRIGELVHDLVSLDTKQAVEFKVLQPYELLVESFEPVSSSSNDRKRKHEETDSAEHEKWDLRHVVFLPNEQGDRTEVVGTIKRMQDNVCIVSYGNAEKINDPGIKIFRKEELCLANQSTRSIEAIIRTPKKLNIGSSKVISAQVDEEATVHLISKNSNSGKIQYGKFDLGTNTFINQPVSLRATPECFSKDDAVQIDHTFGDVPCILLDSKKIHQPIFFNEGTLQDPEWFWLGLPPINALTSSIYNMTDVTETRRRDRAFVALICLDRHILSPILIKNNPDLLKALLSVLSDNPIWQGVIPRLLGEVVDGERNLLHVCIDSNAPSKDKKNQTKSDVQKSLAEMIESISVIVKPEIAEELRQKITQKMENSNRSSVICAPFSKTRSNKKEDSGSSWKSVPKENCLEILLGHSCLSSSACEKLLQEKDAFGRTPFMYAIIRRAYKDAALIFERILNLCEAEKSSNSSSAIKKFIFPDNSPRELNPLYVLCCNDTCSYTWTKKQHIKQDIYECKTCNLTESLCCCTECAQTCHVGHECVLKKTSPTAYCDCPSSCACKALNPGDQKERELLLEMMLTHTQLFHVSTNKGEHILQFLAHTVARQIKEQNNLAEVDNQNLGARRSHASSSSSSRESPPVFCRKALQYCLAEWKAVEGLVVFKRDSLSASYYSSKYSNEDKTQLESQQGVARLDKFVQTLLLRLSHSSQWDYMGALLNTLTEQYKLAKGTDREETVLLGIHRFIRSVVRVYVCFAGNLQPSTMTNEAQRKCLERFTKVFQELPDIAIEELCQTSDALLAPVRLGAVRPVPGFEFFSNSNDAIGETDELFRVDPCAPKRKKSDTPRMSNRPVNNREGIQGRNFSRSTRRLLNTDDRSEFGEEHSGEGNNRTQRASRWGSAARNQAIRSFERRLNEVHQQRSNRLQEEIDERDAYRARGGWNLLEELDIPETDHSENDDQMDATNDRPIEEIISDQDGDDRENDQDENEGEEDGEITGDDEGAEDEEELPVLQINENNQLVLDDNPYLEEEDILHNGPPEDYGGWPTGNFNEDGTDEENSEHDDHEERDEEEVDEDDDMEDQEEMDQDEDRWGDGSTFDVGSPLYDGDHRESTPFDDESFEGIFPDVDIVHLRNSRRRLNDQQGSGNLSWAVRESRYRMRDPRESGGMIREGFGALGGADPSKRNMSLSGSCQTSESQSKLARCAALCIKQVALLLQPDLNRPSTDSDQIMPNVQRLLRPSWEWLMTTMDWTESQLRYGATLSKVSETRRNHLRLRNDSDGQKRTKNHIAAHEFMTYALSLMRQQNSEHSDVMPSIDVGALRHVAYVLDAFISLLKSERALSSTPRQSQKTDSPGANETPTHIFFRRSDSMLFLGGANDDPFETPFDKALPLADKPHLLRPKASKEELFGRGTRGEGKQAPQSSVVRLPEHMSLTRRYEESEFMWPVSESNGQDNHVEPDALLSRWKSCVEIFARVFMDDVGSEQDSVLRQLASFNLRQSKFQKQMEDLQKGAKNSELSLVVHRQREKLIPQTIKQLNDEFAKKESKDQSKSVRSQGFWSGMAPVSRPSSRADGLMVSKKIKVRFEGEPGEGNGVMRSFFTTIADAFLEDLPVPKMDVLPPPSSSSKSEYISRRSGLSGLQRYQQRQNKDKGQLNVNAAPWSPGKGNDDPHAKNSSNDLKKQLYEKIHSVDKLNAAKITGMFLQSSASNRLLMTNDEDLCKMRVAEAVKVLKENGQYIEEKPASKKSDPDDEPLFTMPSTSQRYYCPNPGNGSERRMNIFRNQILGRRVNWHDLAFYDSTIFESLRKLVLSAKEHPESVEDLGFTFEIDETTRDGTIQSVELIPDGQNIAVTSANVYTYVRKYAHYIMVKKWENAVEHLRKGIFDVVSEQALAGLTPEDWWLLVNGVATVDVAKLTAMTTFNDESNAKDESEKNDVQKLQKWLWEVVDSFTQQERQELLYFWTGAPALRAGEEAFEPAPSVTIRGPNDQSLPSANTCISRLYLPLYSSKAILRQKLSMAIKTKTFGFV
ncbi:Oidioi.mRNA.OKI2018_I69.chr1.g2520.t1.cds [Oikopleura dioica]|uniref:Oidioi.mRNA.OKI2018_I69.chr1.g2520.t1.cds n=1 Tax=Oikopleura dioica TaxID=34765 RepID=A0ABN7ST35_OIKDI|nr:Oidioi.mRNA.OKI2018_I69.chr1.g2520.t1.cds [Oikopleura dioica]